LIFIPDISKLKTNESTKIKVSNKVLTSSFNFSYNTFSSNSNFNKEEKNISLNRTDDSINLFDKSFDKDEEIKLDLCRKINQDNDNNDFYDNFYI